MEMGQPLTGITWKDGDKLPTDNFEITLQAMKRKGDDFFCGLTFPVRDSHATFVVGGWAGTVVGLSSINGLDASENETTQYEKLDQNKWYTVRVRVADGKIECWLDDKQMVDVELQGQAHLDADRGRCQQAPRHLLLQRRCRRSRTSSCGGCLIESS